jgi:hypothetical protein
MTAPLFKALTLIPACIGVLACAPRPNTETTATLAAHEAVLQELPRDFYEPGLGDLMHALQLRHAKLWFAAREGNWELAAFELHEIHESLDRVARWHADSDDIPMAPSIKAYMQPGRYALDQSIRQRDSTKFAPAFDRLTQRCNECHQAAKHSFIVIRRPVSDPVGNQSWSAAATP